MFITFRLKRKVGDMVNCPKCLNGVLQKAGEVNMQPTLSKSIYPRLEICSEDTPFHLSIYICSLDTCGYTTFLASDQFLGKLKEQRYEFYNNHQGYPAKNN